LDQDPLIPAELDELDPAASKTRSASESQGPAVAGMAEARIRASGRTDWLIRAPPPDLAKMAAKMTVFIMPADCIMPFPE